MFYLLIVGKLELEIGDDAVVKVKDKIEVLKRGLEKQDDIQLQDLYDQELVELMGLIQTKK